jgi:hypothetical protein
MDLSQEPNNIELRQRLDEITDLPTEPVNRHARLVADLVKNHNHSIHPVEDPSVRHVPFKKYTCFMYAFDLADSDAVRRIARALKEVYPGREFIEYLIARCLSEVPAEKISDRDVVVYADSEKSMHAGKMAGERVVSKWGNDYLWSHRLFEVPAKYGNQARFFSPIPVLVAEKAFIAHAKKHEGDELIEELLSD